MARVQTMAATQQAPARDGGVGEQLNDKNFRRLCAYVQESCGIKLTPKKKSMIDGRLRRRMRALNIANINDYASFLLDGDAAETELVNFIDAITTNKTDFFREPAHFVFLQRRALPAYRKEGRRGIKVWSAASSMGAEAYTIAMVIDDFFRGQGGIDFKILGTDICTEVLAKGRAALYSDSMLEPIPEEYRRRYILVPKDPVRREFRIAAKLRSKVSFHQLNLMDDRYPFDRDFDMIFLRNVLIYFERPTQEAVLTKLCGHLKPGGYLFLGHSESLAGTGLPLVMAANTIFRRE
jgi:chemotaxis protein methyltransferase CheR